jgi:hypothetical protein
MHNNINIKKTKEELGIDVFKLKPNSCKLVYKICEICKKEDKKNFRAINIFKQTKCLKCSNKINAQKNTIQRGQKIKKNQKKNGHPRLGRKHTLEARKKISKNRKTPALTKEQRQKISNRTKGENNPFYNKTHSKKTKEKMSILAKKRAKRGKDSNLYGKSYYAKSIPYITKSGKVIKLKSSWEYKVAEYLDLKNIKWEYEKEFFPITYEYEGEIKHGTYTPDFFLKSGDIWEVKGYFRKDARIKFQTFKKTYPDKNIKLMQKSELQELGIKLHG